MHRQCGSFYHHAAINLAGDTHGRHARVCGSLGEFGATISFVSNIPGETQTIPLAMFTFLETPGSEMEAARLCAISIAIALGSLFISEWLSRRMQRRLGLTS